MKPARLHRVELIVTLATLGAMAPFSVDMYLPALPTLAQFYATSEAATERTMAAYFLGFAIGQMAFGPLADRFGRKRPLYAGLILFIAASLGCALAPNILSLTVLRFFQALGACAGAVISRAVVRDLFEPRDAAHIMSRIILSVAVAPLIAPLIGGNMLVWFGWQAIFFTLAAAGAIALAAAVWRLKESHKLENARSSLHMGDIFRDYVFLLREPHFRRHALAAGLGAAGLFAWITAAPNILIKIFSVPPERFGLYFGLNAVGIIAISQLNAYLLKRYEPRQLQPYAHVAQAAAAIVLLTDTYFGWGGLFGVLIPCVCYVAMNGSIQPLSSALALAPHPMRAGLASALMGTLQFSFAGLAALAVSSTQTPSALHMALVIAFCGVGGAILHFVLKQGPHRPSPI